MLRDRRSTNQRVTLTRDEMKFRRTKLASMLLLLVLLACNPPEPVFDGISILVVPDGSVSNVDAGAVVPRPEARFNTARPTRISTLGGTRLTVIGRFFDGETRISVDGVRCDSMEFHSETRLSCLTPGRAEAGPASLRVEWSDGYEEGYGEILSYFVPLSIAAVVPDRVSAASGETVILTGTGFVELMSARIGGIIIRPQLISDTQTRLELPRMEPAVYDVELGTADETVRLREALTVVSPLVLSDVAPAVGTVRGGDRVRLSGVGLRLDSTVTFGTRTALVLDARDDQTAIFVEMPTAGSTGLVDVGVQNSNGVAVLEDGYLYTRFGGSGFEVDDLRPTSLPTTGGTGFWIGGSGFDDLVRVSIDGQTWGGCSLDTPNRIFCDPGPRAEGNVAVVVESGDGELSDPLWVTFFNEPVVFGMQPTQGLVSGGTLVEISGQGFTADMDVWIDDLPVSILTVNSDRILGLTPPGAVGSADLRIDKGTAVVVSPDAYQYVDTGTPFGGAWGQAIERNLNISVFDNRNRRPVSGATVRVQSVLSGRAWVGPTNTSGQVVIADLDLEPPLTITVGHPEYTSASMDRVVAQNVSLLIAQKTPEEGEGNSESEPLVSISGMVTGINAQEKPEEGGLLTVALVETTHLYANGRFATPMPTPSSILVEDGPYELLALPGQFGIIVSVGFVAIETWEAFQEETINYWAFRRELIPRAMGYTPFLTGYPGDVLDDIHVEVDRPRLEQTDVVLDNPPGGVGQAPNTFLARATLDLGADGFFDLGVQSQDTVPTLRLFGLPQIADWPENHVRMRWEGEAFVTPDEIVTANRFSWSSITTDTVEPVTVIGPFLPTTEVIEPSFESVVQVPVEIRWIEHPGVEPERTQEIAHLHYLNLSNQDGLVWTGWLPGALDTVTPPIAVPPLSEQLPDLNLYYLSVFSALANEPFSFDDFSFSDLGGLRAYSWSFTRFSDGEIPEPEPIEN
jgi:hypothetical protein